MSQRKFAAFDIDGTLFRSGLYREVMFELIKMKAVPDTIAMQIDEKMRAWRDRLHGNAFEEFELAITSYLDQELIRLKIADYDLAVQKVLAVQAENVYVYTRDLIKQLKADGYFLIAISGSQQELVEPFAQKYGFDTWIGQAWERGEEYFTGKITKTHTDKDITLSRFIADNDLTLDDSWAVGDSNGDVGMLNMVHNAVAFNPTFELQEKAISAGWKIVVERKNVIYQLEERDGSYILAETRPF